FIIPVPLIALPGAIKHINCGWYGNTKTLTSGNLKNYPYQQDALEMRPVSLSGLTFPWHSASV
ncbi:TPA: hypothetical protein ACV2AH_005304, partial [Escherichia coli]